MQLSWDFVINFLDLQIYICEMSKLTDHLTSECLNANIIAR